MKTTHNQLTQSTITTYEESYVLVIQCKDWHTVDLTLWEACPWFNILLGKQALPPFRLSHRCPKHTDTHMVFGNAFELKNVESRHPRFVNIPITSAFHNLRQLEADRLFNIYETWDVFRTGWLSLQMKKLNYSTSFIASPWADVVFCLRHKNPLELGGALIKASCLRSSIAQVPKFYYLQLITDFGVFALSTWMRV